jgi:hypothetical protein
MVSTFPPALEGAFYEASDMQNDADKQPRDTGQPLDLRFLVKLIFLFALFALTLRFIPCSQRNGP